MGLLFLPLQLPRKDRLFAELRAPEAPTSGWDDDDPTLAIEAIARPHSERNIAYTRFNVGLAPSHIVMSGGRSRTELPSFTTPPPLFKKQQY